MTEPEKEQPLDQPSQASDEQTELEDWAETEMADLDQVEIPELAEPLIADDPAQPGRPDSKARRFFRKLFRWTVGILVIFGAGFLLAILTIYQSTRLELNRVQYDLNLAEQQIADLNNQLVEVETQIASQANDFGNLRIENDELLAAQNHFELQIAILDARVDVANATLAMQADDFAKARLILNGAADTLVEIQMLLPLDQRAALDPLNQRLELVLAEMDGDPFAALSDLNVLETQLLQLQSNLFD